VGLFLLAVASVLLLAATAATQAPVGTLGGDPLLAAPAALAAAFGVASAGLGGYAIVHHERALLLLLTTAAGLNVLAYVLGEAIRTR
jgi:hypothetical protein